MKEMISSLENMGAYAKKFLAELAPEESIATLVTLSGDLGAGKTAFTKALARELGVVEDVTSPTFVLEKIYALVGSKWKHLIHIDAYRFESSRELLSIGFEEIYADPGNLIVLEWPEKVEEALREKKMKKLSFKHIDENTREISQG